MKLPFPFFKDKEKQESNYYLALLLTDEKASAVILKESAGKLKFLGKHQESFTSSLEEATQEELTSTKAERDKAVADATVQTKRADKLTEDLNKTRQERDDAQTQLAAYKAT